MAYRKKTLRSMSPTTRKVARLVGELESVVKRFKNLMPEIQRIETDSQSLWKIHESQENGELAGDKLKDDEIGKQMIAKASQDFPF